MSKLDKYTFGKSAAEVVLAERLLRINDKKLTAYTQRFLSTISKHVKNVKTIDQSIGTNSMMYMVLKKHYSEIIDSSPIVSSISDDITKTFIKNCARIRLSSLLK